MASLCLISDNTCTCTCIWNQYFKFFLACIDFIFFSFGQILSRALEVHNLIKLGHMIQSWQWKFMIMRTKSILSNLTIKSLQQNYKQKSNWHTIFPYHVYLLGCFLKIWIYIIVTYLIIIYAFLMCKLVAQWQSVVMAVMFIPAVIVNAARGSCV